MVKQFNAYSGIEHKDNRDNIFTKTHEMQLTVNCHNHVRVFMAMSYNLYYFLDTVA